jgi:hypothetical protein
MNCCFDVNFLLPPTFFAVSEEKFLHQIYMEEKFGPVGKSGEEDKKKQLADKRAAIPYSYDDSAATKGTKGEEAEGDEDEDDDSDIDLGNATDTVIFFFFVRNNSPFRRYGLMAMRNSTSKDVCVFFFVRHVRGRYANVKGAVRRDERRRPQV